MKRFYVIEDVNGRRVYLGDIEVSPLVAGNELTEPLSRLTDPLNILRP